MEQWEKELEAERQSKSAAEGSTMNLSQTDKITIVRLLGVLQDYLESSIESSLVPETNEPSPEDTAEMAEVARDRRTWKQAEDMIKKLQAKPPRGSWFEGYGTRTRKR